MTTLYESAAATEIAPRVFEIRVAQETVVSNQSPVDYRHGNLPIPPGCLVVTRSGLFQARDSGIAEALGLDRVPGLSGVDCWGPDPDPKLVEGTGSPRVWTGVCPAARLPLEELERREVYEAGAGWVDVQGIRGGCFSSWVDPLAGHHYIGQGYQTVDGPLVGGGFSTKGNPARVLPEFNGEVYGLSGWPVPTAQHADNSALATFSLTYRSVAAMMLAQSIADVVVSQMVANEYMPSRSWGWAMKCLAYAARLAAVWGDLSTRPAAWYSAAYSELLARLEARAYYGAPAPDNGKTSEGGHLVGYISDSTFYVGLHNIGGLDSIELAGVQEAWGNVERGLGFLSSCWLTEPDDPDEPDGPTFSYFAEDRAPIEGLIFKKRSAVVGVHARMILPALARLFFVHGRAELEPWVFGIVRECDRRGTWGGGNRTRTLWIAESCLPSDLPVQS